MSMGFDALISIAGISAGLAIFYGPWRGVCTDLSRQLMFEQRDRLFQLGASGQLDFNSDAYRQIMKFVNNHIRFAHESTAARTVWFSVWVKVKKIETGDTPMAIALKSLDGHQASAEVLRIIERVQRASVVGMAAKSLPFVLSMLLFLPSLIVAVGFERTKVMSRINSLLRKPAPILDAEVRLSYDPSRVPWGRGPSLHGA